MAKVKLKNVSKKFGKFTAVNGVNLDITDGQFLVLLGPSGCGKSTVLKMVAGLEKPTSGQIYIGDALVADAVKEFYLAPKDRDIAMVFQNYALYPHMDCYENMAFPLKLRKMSKNDIDKLVRDTAKFLGIEDLLKKRPGQLSGGQRQRVALGRAIVRHPKVFLMDEPLSNLDAKLRLRMRVELKNMQKELGITMIYVTHDQVEAMTMADEMAVINDGALQQVGKPEEIYRKPVNTFVAGFVGSPPMNLLDAEVTGTGDVAIGEIIRLQIPGLPDMAKNQYGGNMIAGIRPEYVNKDENGIAFDVKAAEPLGNMRVVYLKNGDLNLAALLSEEDLNDKIRVTLRADKIHIFDKKTGNVLFTPS
ncbi:MAG: sn-glycerol-3-phosphate ABC transporter ATP-binding protein UgpC [Dehalococcoidia bacterium]|nr:sn-glycerol-3-phosphate ABC transporter ATP-binding protein UgpC [Dehalococcoidia bacterium]